MDQSNDPGMTSPLLEESKNTMAGASAAPSGGRAVTLHGEPIDLRDMFPSGMGTGGGVLDAAVNENNNGGDDSSGTEEDVVEARTPSSETLSMGGEVSNSHRPPSTMDYVRQAAFYLPRKGRAFYYRSRHRLTSSFASRRGARRETVRASNTAAAASHRRESEGATRNKIAKRSALVASPSTPLLLKLLIPALIMANHYVFYQAQTAPMWNLAYKTDVTITATAQTLKAKAAADALNIPHHYEFVHKEEAIVETFTYMDAINKLWKGEGLGDAQTISKVAAVLLVIASGIWPHVKLLLVHLCWLFPFSHALWIGGGGKCCGRKRDGNGCAFCCSNGRAHQTTNVRSPFLRVLSTLGKWSLADVLVVCILIAVLHLDWEVDPDAIRKGVEAELPTILDYAQQKFPDDVDDCTQLLGYECGQGALVIHYPACFACKTLVKNAFHHPEWTTGEGESILEGIDLEGGGHAQLRVAGMVGTYYFCGAVVASILLSLIVEFVDERDRRRAEEDLIDRRRELEFVLEPANGSGLELDEEGPLSPAGNNPQSAYSRSIEATSYARLEGGDNVPTPTTNCHLLKQALLVLLSLASLPLVIYAVTLPSMERLVYGGGPTLLHEVLGMVWEREYSLITLVKTTGEAGGRDAFLMVTFGLFAVVGPLLRSVCLILHVLLGLPLVMLVGSIEQPRKRTHLRTLAYRATTALRSGLLSLVDALGAFGCWEVLLVALYMIQLEIPSITDTIYQDDRCAEADPAHGRTCIEVQFNATDGVLVVAVAWATLVAASGLAMSLAVEADVYGPPLAAGEGEEARYEYGQPIPRRRSEVDRPGGGEDDDDEYFSPLQGGGGGGGAQDDGMEQIVFI